MVAVSPMKCACGMPVSNACNTTCKQGIGAAPCSLRALSLCQRLATVANHSVCWGDHAALPASARSCMMLAVRTTDCSSVRLAARLRAALASVRSAASLQRSWYIAVAFSARSALVSVDDTRAMKSSCESLWPNKPKLLPSASSVPSTAARLCLSHSATLRKLAPSSMRSEGSARSA